MGSSLRFGGTMEIAGLNENINPVRVQGIIQSVPKYYRISRRGTSTESSRGAAFVLLAGRFALCRPNGELPKLSSIATGHAMMGPEPRSHNGKLMAEICPANGPHRYSTSGPRRYARLSATSAALEA